MYYVPRVTVAYDKVFNEDPGREYTKAVSMEMYIKNVEGFAGDGDFLSKFGLEIRDQITFCVARRAFNDEISATTEALDRPREGDLVYFPLNKKLFEIRFVEHEAIFYQLGSLQMYELRCELFEYNNEYFDTGIEDIDKLYKLYRSDSDQYNILTEDGEPIIAESGAALLQEAAVDTAATVVEVVSNETFETQATTFIDFSENDPFSEGAY